MEYLHNENWLIKKESNTIFFQSKLLLNNNFKHAFFTRKTEQNNPEFLNKLLGNKSSIHFLHQIHSNKVINASTSNYPSIQKGDSITSDGNLQSLWLYTADCIPILIGDKRRGNVSAIHSGWKGIAKNNIKVTIKKLEEFGSRRNNLVVALGPAISRERYIVEEDVINSIYKSIENDNKLSNQQITRRMILLNCVQMKGNKLFMLDLREAAKKQLTSEGLKENQISINLNCTYSEEILFNSWRRDKRKERQWSFIEANLDNFSKN